MQTATRTPEVKSAQRQAARDKRQTYRLATVALRSPDERPHVSHEAAAAGHLSGLDSNWPRTLLELGNGDALNREHQPTINRIVRNLHSHLR